MSKICLTEGFTLIPEGTYVFKITEVTYKEEFGKMEIKMETAKGLKHTEHFSLMSKDGKQNEGAYNAFSFFAKTALNDFTRKVIDHEELVGLYIQCVVEHDTMPSNKDPNKNVTFVRLSDKYPADGFEDGAVPAPAPTQKSTKKKAEVTPVGELDLDALLG